ncbi:monooxygenase [Agromyces rhizosphaerae]|uniref:Monooxygenase n=1 Tax=Agromyces rhizosphaerae TaxID=88374 RepID=A0A9W6CVR1_9MICO|nr:FAD-dependent monooxygenase [Agromyces rhizosphaerae]GLI26946.1 monooxygenase [Agromyces rhizosphaerae]
MTDDVLPVLIIGGGPVGLALAAELGFHRIPVTVVEPRVEVEHSRPRAKTTSVRTMEHFRRWGIADDLRAAAPLDRAYSQRVTFVQHVTGSEIAHIDGCLGLDTGPEISPEPAQQVTQPIVEEVLRRHLDSVEDVDLLLGWTATAIEQYDDRVTVRLEDATGRPRLVRARWVVGADGPRSIVRRAMGARYEGSAGGRKNVNITFRSSQLQALVPHPASIHFWVLDPDAPGVIGPLDRDGTWWAISTGTESVDDTGHAQRIVRSLVGHEIDVEVVATDPWQARMLLADRYRDGRLFLVGDAAHQNPPWGGHGFNTGVGDAVNLGWKLAAVIDGWAPEDLLDSYDAERRAIEQQTIALAASNMAVLSPDLGDPALMGEGDDFEVARSRLAPRIVEAKAPEFFSEGLILGYGYGPTSGEQAPTPAEYHPKLAAGNRLPHRWIDGRSIFDVLGPRFTVVGPEERVAPLLRAATRRAVPVSHLEQPGPELVLVRPDQHIAWVGESIADADGILDGALHGFAEHESR